MKTALRRTIALALPALVLLLLAGPAMAQEDESGSDDEGWGKFLVDVALWAPTAGGIGDGVAGLGNPLSTQSNQIGFEHPSEGEPVYRIGVDFARNIGRVTFSQFKHFAHASLSMRDPGNFRFAETLAFPLHAGLANDGLADAFDARTRLDLRESRAEYSREAFSNSRVTGRWLVGVRRVDFVRDLDVTYHSLVPTFPAFVPPLTIGLPGLAPIPDTVVMRSTFEAGGVTAGMEFDAPLGTDKILLEANVSLSILVGDVTADFRGVNSFYTLGGTVLEAPYSELGDYTVDMAGNITGTAALVNQESIFAAVGTNNSSVTSQALEIDIGFRWKAIKMMDMFLGFRMSHYANVATEIRPSNVIVTGTSTINVAASRTDQSVTYEGFYGGLGFRF